MWLIKFWYVLSGERRANRIVQKALKQYDDGVVLRQMNRVLFDRRLASNLDFKELSRAFRETAAISKRWSKISCKVLSEVVE